MLCFSNCSAITPQIALSFTRVLRHPNQDAGLHVFQGIPGRENQFERTDRPQIRSKVSRFGRKNLHFWSLISVVIAITFCGNRLDTAVFAGATASNWVIVVNGQSVNSRTLANQYCSARDMPSRNVIVLPAVPDSDQISVDQFRELILGPVLQEIETRGLAGHIQGHAYSADFPTAITIGSDIDAVANKSPYLTSVGSINGLTYLFRFVLAKNPSYIGFESNMYAARPVNQLLRPTFETVEQAKQFAEFLEQSKHEEAAKLIDSIIPRLDIAIQFPMQYLAAQQWAQAGDAALATRHIEKSIRGGWTYRDFLLNDPVFASLKDDKDFKRIANRCQELPSDYLPSRGFDARTFYSPNTLGSNAPNGGISYMMSMVLAVTRDLGVAPFEAKRNLLASIRADYSHPQGSFVFCKTDDVRTKTREPNFAMAISKLQSRGMKARVIEQALPPHGENCSGVMMGTPDFSWNQGGANLLPGSIADNLTSLGGAMTTAAQTKATEFLRYGAAASSGAVTEPYSIQNKFPHPMIHVHYVDGLSAAEAFYSSVLCPYQLLIVGDPLCQPYCNPPRFAIKSKSDITEESQSMQISLQTIESSSTTEPDVLQMLINGVLRSQAPFEPQFRMSLNKAEPGAHEVRLISKAAKPIEERFEQNFWISLGKADEQLKLVVPNNWRLSEDKPLKISIQKSSELGEIQLIHDFEEIGTFAIGQDSIVLSPSNIGYGPVRLHAQQTVGNGKIVRSLPAVILVEP